LVGFGVAFTVAFKLDFGEGVLVALIAPDVPRVIAAAIRSVRSGRFLSTPRFRTFMTLTVLILPSEAEKCEKIGA
jgi:hypothetical protein